MPDLGLVACGKKKLDHPAPAGELYQGGFFKACRAYVEHECEQWAILSALHGLVLPDTVLAPYNVKLSDLSAAEQRAWCARVRGQLAAQFPACRSILTTAGKEYRAALDGAYDVTCPWDTLPEGKRGIGFQLQWLTAQR